MPKVYFEDIVIEVAEGSVLRKALRSEGISPHNGAAKQLNCKGMGTCGTCCVFLEGNASPKTKVEQWRLGFPPHKNEAEKRLACQVKVLGDLHIRKGQGFWGERS